MFRREYIFHELGMFESLVILIKSKSNEYNEFVNEQHKKNIKHFDGYQQDIKIYEKIANK